MRVAAISRESKNNPCNGNKYFIIIIINIYFFTFSPKCTHIPMLFLLRVV